MYRKFYISGTEEEYTELCQLLEDIASYVKGLKRRHATKLTAIEFMEKKFLKKAELKEKELVLRRVELELQQKNFEAEEERKQRLQLEMEERRAIIEIQIQYFYLSTNVRR